jgi:hypothetical protein
MITKQELKGRVWRFLNKTPQQTGFFTDAKMEDAIREAMDYISVEMFLAGEGWMQDFIYLDTVSGMESIPLPTDVAMIRNVRYKVGDIYVPLDFNEAVDSASYLRTGNNQVGAFQYRLLGSRIVFDPPLSDGGEKYLQLEVTKYPSNMINDNDVIDPQFDNACLQFMKYKIASILSASLEKTVIPWLKEEAMWEGKMKQIVTRRNLRSTTIMEYDP